MVLTNPVIHGSIQVQLKANTVHTLWSADGKQLYSKAGQKGLNSIAVNHLPKGSYILQAGNESRKIIIQ